MTETHVFLNRAQQTVSGSALPKHPSAPLAGRCSGAHSPAIFSRPSAGHCLGTHGRQKKVTYRLLRAPFCAAVSMRHLENPVEIECNRVTLHLSVRQVGMLSKTPCCCSTSPFTVGLLSFHDLLCKGNRALVIAL